MPVRAIKISDGMTPHGGLSYAPYLQKSAQRSRRRSPDKTGGKKEKDKEKDKKKKN